MKILNIAVFLAAAFLAVSCVTGPVAIPEDLSAAELIQRALEASDRNRYNISLQYYEAVVDRFPWDTENACAAEYEIAFIHYKQKKYELSKTEFNALLERYDNPEGEQLPPQYKVLAIKLLEIISEKEGSLRIL